MLWHQPREAPKWTAGGSHCHSWVALVLYSRFPRLSAVSRAQLQALGHSCPHCSLWHCHTSLSGSAWHGQGGVRGSAAPGKPADVCPCVRPSVCPCLLPGPEPRPRCVGEHGQCRSHFPAATSRCPSLSSAGLMWSLLTSRGCALSGFCPLWTRAAKSRCTGGGGQACPAHSSFCSSPL